MIGSFVPASRLSLCNGLATFSACLGMAATYALFGHLMDWCGWPGAFYVASGFTLAVALLWIGYAPRPPASGLRPAGVRRDLTAPQPTRSPFLHPGLLCLTASYAALGYFQYLFFYWIEYYFKEILHYSLEASRTYSTVVVLANGLGMVVGGWLTDRAARSLSERGRAVIPIVGLAGSGVALIAGLASVQPITTLLCFATAMAALGMCEGPFWTTAVAIGGRRGGTTGAMMNTGGNAGGLLAPVLTPELSRYLGWQWGMGLAGAVAILGALFWLGVDPRDSLDRDSS